MKNNSLFLLLLLFATVSFGQSKTELQAKRKQLIKEINQTNQLLSKNKEATSIKLSDLGLLINKSNKIEELTKTIQTEIRKVNQEMNSIEQSIAQNKEELSLLKASYSKNMVAAYKQKKTLNMLAFLISAKSIQQAYRRSKYIKQINAYYKQQGVSIQQKTEQLQDQQQQLLKQKEEKQALFASQQIKLEELKQNKLKIEEAVKQLKTKTKELRAQLSIQKAERNQLEAQIKTVIAREIAEARAREEARKNEVSATPSEPKIRETSVAKAPALSALSASFASNRGKLPWPTDYGVIVSSMGEYGMIDLPGIKKERDGIDIRTQPNAAVKSVFKGQVRSVTTIAGFNKVVIISHGEYYSVYGRLANVQVSVGDEVDTNTTIGTVDDQMELHFQLWNGQIKENPTSWLSKQ